MPKIAKRTTKKELPIAAPAGVVVVEAHSPEIDQTHVMVPWKPIVGVLAVLALYVLSQIVGSLAISVYPLLKHWTHAHATSWLQNDVLAQFGYILIAESFTVGSIYLFLRHYKRGFSSIGLHRPRWRDPAYGVIAVPFYLIIYVLTVGVVSNLIHGFNVSQQQQIGFSNVHGAAQLIMTAISLVVLPPIAEEIMVRGLLYTSLRKWLPQIVAALVTSALFASAHLPEGGAAGPLWIAALDTFILSIFLIALREKTKNLWASMTLHACKNGIAYYALFLAPLIHVH